MHVDVQIVGHVLYDTTIMANEIGNPPPNPLKGLPPPPHMRVASALERIAAALEKLTDDKKA